MQFVLVRLSIFRYLNEFLLVAASSRPGAWCLDPFAGSGTLGAVCRALDRRFVLIDCNPEAVEIMRARLGGRGVGVGGPAAGASGE